MKYKSVVCGGTFDGIHKGHQALLKKAFEVGEKVTIGLTSDEYVVKFKYQDNDFDPTKRRISLYKDRKYRLVEWLEKNKFRHRAHIVSIDDSYGPTIPGSSAEPYDFQAIIASDLTRETVEKINTLRARAGWPLFEVVTIPVVKDEDGRPISSTNMRKAKEKVEKLVLTPELRKELKKPLGQLYTKDEDIREHVKTNIEKVLITVGDVATKRFLDMGVMPSLAIVDLRVGRNYFQPIEAYRFPKDVPVVKVTSGPGYISPEAIKAVQDWSENHLQNRVILVEGEEDLLVLPVVVSAPLGSLVYYGQPKEGIVKILVNEKKRQEIAYIIQQFIK